MLGGWNMIGNEGLEGGGETDRETLEWELGREVWNGLGRVGWSVRWCMVFGVRCLDLCHCDIRIPIYKSISFQINPLH